MRVVTPKTKAQKEAHRKVCKKYYDANSDEIIARQKSRYDKKKQLKHRLKCVYKITLEEFNEILNKQDNKCAICGMKETIKNKWGLKQLAIDHNHETGKVRGLLCDRCNRGLGYFKENTDSLLKAILYLRRNK